MARVSYEVVRHDTGWAYKVGDVFSETFGSHEAAFAAAQSAAARQQLAGDTSDILYEDADGNWHRELARGEDRPETTVEDGDDEAADDEVSASRFSRDVGADEPLPDGPAR